MRAIFTISAIIQSTLSCVAFAAGNHELGGAFAIGSGVTSGLWIAVEVFSLVRFMSKRV